jgi:hypothetical protein
MGSPIDLLHTVSDPKYAACLVSFLLVVCGYVTLTKMKADSPFEPYALQILGLTFILPIVLLSALLLKIESQAVVGLLGTIIGYIFGTSRVSGQKGRRRREKDEEDGDRD